MFAEECGAKWTYEINAYGLGFCSCGVEIQDPHRGSAQSQGHGVCGRRGAGEREQGSRRLLDVEAGVRGAGQERAEEVGLALLGAVVATQTWLPGAQKYSI